MTGYVTEQVEPLGQKIDVADPEAPFEPQTYAQHLFFASDPEWQCEAAGLGAYGSLFKDLPEHCQRKALYAAGAYLPWEGEVTSVTKISKPNSPFHEARHQLEPAQKTMQNTLSITDKFASSGGPSSGDGGWYQSGDMQWDVYVNPDFPSDIELSLDPANAGDFVSVSFDSSADARKALESVLQGDCATKLNALLGALKPEVEGKSNPLRSTDFMSLFDNIVSQAKGGLFTQQSFQEANAKYLELYPNGTVVAGGGGLSFAEWPGRNRAGVAVPSDAGSYMYVYVFPRTASTFDYDRNRPASSGLIRERINRTRKALTAILIHELAHGAE